MKHNGARIFRDIHVSGHAAREDLRDFLTMLKPKHIIPAHGFTHMTKALRGLTKEMEIDQDKVHLMTNGMFLKLE